MTTVNEVMTRGIKTLGPSDTVTTAAKAMDELNVGVIPICEGGKLLGVVTDRDIVVRAVALGLELSATKLSDVMSSNVRTVEEGDDVDDILQEMAQSQIRRLPVVDASGMLIGIVSLGDVASKSIDDETDVGESLAAISSPAEPDRS